MSWEEATTYTNRYGETPLHIACRNSQRSCFVVSRLIKHSPEVLTMRNEYGEIPLLVAFKSGSFLPVIKELVQANTATLLMTDDKGRMPAHTLWTLFVGTIPGAMQVRRNMNADGQSEGANISGGLLQHFWEKFKFVLLETNRLECHSSGHTFNEKELYHMIIAQNFKCAHIPLLLSLKDNPDLGLQGDSDGNTPLHIEATEGNAQLILFLLCKCVASASVRNNNGQVPLHFAAKSKFSWKKTLYPVVQAIPDSLCWKDPMTKLYPFMLAALVNDADNTFQLLRAAPHVLNQI